MEGFVTLLDSDGSGRAGAFLNLLTCLVAMLLIFGRAARRQPGDAAPDRTARTGWFLFWLLTAGFYLARTFHPDDCFLVFLPLYAATLALFSSFLLATHLGRTRRTVTFGVSVAIVVLVVVVDLLVLRIEKNNGIHQVFVAIVLGLWAWQLSGLKDGVAKSIDLMIYAIVQLPLLAIATVLGVRPEAPSQHIIGATYLLYAVLKLRLIEPVRAIIEPAPAAS